MHLLQRREVVSVMSFSTLDSRRPQWNLQKCISFALYFIHDGAKNFGEKLPNPLRDLTWFGHMGIAGITSKNLLRHSLENVQVQWVSHANLFV
jgi:hypothetical protein